MSEERPSASLPATFLFSQASLSDYLDCPRRFQLRYVQEQDWPAVESEPLIERERLADLGRRFHRLVQQRFRGLPVDALSRSAAADPDLALWWDNFSRLDLDGWLPPDRQAEVSRSIPFGTHRLVALYDLLATGDGRAVIVDWKTERRRPLRADLMRRMQTRVYRYVLAKSHPSMAPESIALVYWFAAHPSDPERLPYDSAQMADDEVHLFRLLADIAARTDAVWPLTPDERQCRFCTYRSLCERGVVAGVAESDDVDAAPDIDFDQIDEIAY